MEDIELQFERRVLVHPMIVDANYVLNSDVENISYVTRKLKSFDNILKVNDSFKGQLQMGVIQVIRLAVPKIIPKESFLIVRIATSWSDTIGVAARILTHDQDRNLNVQQAERFCRHGSLFMQLDTPEHLLIVKTMLSSDSTFASLQEIKVS